MVSGGKGGGCSRVGGVAGWVVVGVSERNDYSKDEKNKSTDFAND